MLRFDESIPNAFKVACIGAGNVGRSWAVVFARAGLTTHIYDVSKSALESAYDRIKSSLEQLKDEGSTLQVSQVLDRIHLFDDLESALEGVGYVQESALENLEFKQEFFEKLDQICSPDVILASSTSALMPGRFINVAKAPERCLVVHPLNPPHVIRAVEICPSEWSSEETIKSAQDILCFCGMKPVTLKKEIAGFVFNRLQAAIIAEGLHLVEQGYCEPGDIETALTDGLAQRWAFLGPFMTGHLNASKGYRSYFELFGETFKSLANDLGRNHEWSAKLIDKVAVAMEEKVSEDRVEEAQKWRDKRLISLSNHLSESPDFGEPDQPPLTSFIGG